jgi:protease-4
LSKLQRLGAALDEFRESSDKPVIAMAGSYSQDAYYIAAHADEVYMHPEGLLFLQGYGVWRNYYKDAIDKLKIDWNVFRVGAYKSAVEPFTRNDMSEEDEAAMTRLVNHLWTDYLAQMRATHGEAPAEENVAVIVAAGEILDGEQPPGTVGGDSTAELLRRARQDKTVKAVVLRVDSPGGSAFASEVIRNEILSLKEAGKPVVASMGSVAASGGYWISMAADRIYASSTTITGSIGIFGMFPTFQRSLAYLGISTDGIGTSKWAGQLRSDRELSEDAKELIQVVIDDGYEDFISRVALHRDLKKEEVDRVAQGQVWTGAQALDFGLIDELGNLDAAVAGAAELASLKPDTYGLKYFEKELTPAEQLFLRLIGGARATGLEPGGLFGEPSPVERLAGDLASALSPLLRFNDPNGVYAYCLFCTVH